MNRRSFLRLLPGAAGLAYGLGSVAQASGDVILRPSVTPGDFLAWWLETNQVKYREHRYILMRQQMLFGKFSYRMAWTNQNWRRIL